jgi:hypothetical protein
MVHTDANGNIVGINGEFVSTSKVSANRWYFNAHILVNVTAYLSESYLIQNLLWNYSASYHT